MFSKLKITNNVVYYDLNTFINIFEVFRLLPISEFVMGMKIRDLKKGNIEGKSFKNALHIVLIHKQKEINCKIFSNGKIHVPGNTGHTVLTEVIEHFISELKKLETKTTVNLEQKENFYYNGDFIVGKYKDTITNRIRVINSKFILVPEEINLIKENGFFYTDDHIRKRGVYNNLGEFIGDSVLKMQDRKNLPKKTSFYKCQNKLYYKYNDKQFGEIIEPEHVVETLDTFEISTVIFYQSIKLELNVSNTNGSFKISATESESETDALDKDILFKLLSKRFTSIYNPNDYPAIKCIVYYNNFSGEITNKSNCSSSTIKIQIYSDRVNLTGRTKEIVQAGYLFIKEQLTELVPMSLKTGNIEKEVDSSMVLCTISELYEMM